MHAGTARRPRWPSTARRLPSAHAAGSPPSPATKPLNPTIGRVKCLPPCHSPPACASFQRIHRALGCAAALARSQLHASTTNSRPSNSPRLRWPAEPTVDMHEHLAQRPTLPITTSSETGPIAVLDETYRLRKHTRLRNQRHARTSTRRPPHSSLPRWAIDERSRRSTSRIRPERRKHSAVSKPVEHSQSTALTLAISSPVGISTKNCRPTNVKPSVECARERFCEIQVEIEGFVTSDICVLNASYGSARSFSKPRQAPFAARAHRRRRTPASQPRSPTTVPRALSAAKIQESVDEEAEPYPQVPVRLSHEHRDLHWYDDYESDTGQSTNESATIDKTHSQTTKPHAVPRPRTRRAANGKRTRNWIPGSSDSEESKPGQSKWYS